MMSFSPFQQQQQFMVPQSFPPHFQMQQRPMMMQTHYLPHLGLQEPLTRQPDLDTGLTWPQYDIQRGRIPGYYQAQPMMMQQQQQPMPFQQALQQQQIPPLRLNYSYQEEDAKNSKEDVKEDVKEPAEAHQLPRDKPPMSQKHYTSKDINLEDLLMGKDTRTTIMLKNIPNKFDQSTIIGLINRNHQDKYDYFYLPMDLKT